MRSGGAFWFSSNNRRCAGGLMRGLHENVYVSVFMCACVHRCILCTWLCGVCVGGKVTDGL